MNDILTNGRVIPRRAIVVYHNKNKDQYYLENRDIKSINGKFSIMEASPLPGDVFRDIAKTYMKKSGPSMNFGGIIPEHLLYCWQNTGQAIVMWYRPAMKRKLNFSSQLKINADAYFNVPATLYLVLDSMLYIFALMTDDRPTTKTKLYQAPFFNIYTDGNVCLGTAPVGRYRAKTFEGEAERFERAFYMAEQSGGATSMCKSPLTKLWKSLINKKAAFPSKKELIQHPKFKTVGDLIDKLMPSKLKGYEQDIDTLLEEDDEDFAQGGFDEEEQVEIETWI